LRQNQHICVGLEIKRRETPKRNPLQLVTTVADFDFENWGIHQETSAVHPTTIDPKVLVMTSFLPVELVSTCSLPSEKVSAVRVWPE
jgi:hypothetical protein